MPDMDGNPREELLFLTLVDVLEEWVENVYDREGGILRSDQLSTAMARAAYACVTASEDAVGITHEVDEADDQMDNPENWSNIDDEGAK